MDVFVARQPIFKRNMQLYGYELLYRKSREHNYFEGGDDTLCTAELIDSSFLVMGYNELIDGTRGFINFSEELLLRGMPAMLPREKVVVEVLERIHITPELLEALKELKTAGYTLALDDFALDMEDAEAAELLALADIVKIEVHRVPREKQTTLIRKYRGRILFLAEHVETREEFHDAAQMGYSLFQGYFFSKPVIMDAREIQSLKSNVVLIIQELQQPDPDIKQIARIFERDVGLSYKLLKLANSVYFSTRKRVKSMLQAIMHIGTDELNAWLHLMFLKGMQTVENRELIKLCTIRAKMLSLLVEGRLHGADGFFIGMFSSLDTLLNQDMEQALSGLPLTQAVKDTLLGVSTPLRPYLDTVLALERDDADVFMPLLKIIHISMEDCMAMYLQALRWQQSLPF